MRGEIGLSFSVVLSSSLKDCQNHVSNIKTGEIPKGNWKNLEKAVYFHPAYLTYMQLRVHQVHQVKCQAG